MVRRPPLAVALTLVALALPAAAGAATTVHARSTRVTLPAACPDTTAEPGCHVVIELRTEPGHAYRARLLVGRARRLIRPGDSGHVTVALTGSGRRLLRRYGSLALSVRRVVRVPAAGGTTTPTVTTSPPPSTTAANCPAQGTPVLPAGSPGMTGVVGGIYVFGGPATPFGCTAATMPPAQPTAGTVVVLDVDGDVVATQSVMAGQTFSLAVKPGTYNVRSTLGTSMGGGGDPYFCAARGQITVTQGSQTPVEVVCDVP